MTVGISTVNLANAWLNVMRGAGNGVTFTAPATLFVELHTADPGSAGNTSVSVGSTTRLAATMSAAASGVLSLTSTIGPWTNGGTSETITHIAVFSLASAGTFYWSAALTASQAWASGNTFNLTALSVSMSPLAA